MGLLDDSANTIYLEGKEGFEFVINSGSIGNIYAGITGVEKDIIDSLKNFWLLAKERGHYSEEVEFASVFNKDKLPPHGIVVECFSKTSSSEGFDTNKHMLSLMDGTTEYLFKVTGGTYLFDSEITCFSLTRDSVSKLADLVITGLNTGAGKYLKSLDINIPANAVKTPKIEPVPIAPGIFRFQIKISIPQILTNYRQITEVNGDLIKEFGYFKING